MTAALTYDLLDEVIAKERESRRNLDEFYRQWILPRAPHYERLETSLSDWGWAGRILRALEAKGAAPPEAKSDKGCILVVLASAWIFEYIIHRGESVERLP